MKTGHSEKPYTRRELLSVAGAALGGLALGVDSATAQLASPTRAAPPLEHIVDLALRTDPALVIGGTPAGNRRIVAVTGGTFTGPGLRGTVLPGGADWIVGRPDGVTQLDVRITMRTDDDQLIYATYRGLVDGTPAAVPVAGGMSEVEGTYWRIVPIFETASEKYAWLNQIVAVGVGQGAQGGVNYAVYAVR